MSTLQGLTDCKYFLDGYCTYGKNCRYRHSFQVTKPWTEICFKWPHVCRNLYCRYRHPPPPSLAVNGTTPFQIHYPQPHSSPVGLFWDIENVHIPRMQNPAHIIQRLRDRFIHKSQSREMEFNCYKCNTSSIPHSVLTKVHHANVRIIDIPDHKRGAVDRRIQLDLDRFERAHRPPATIVLISSDVDYVGKLNDLCHHGGYYVVVVHNKACSEDLWTSINAHYSWSMFTEHQDSESFLSPPAKHPLPLYQCPDCLKDFCTLEGLHQHQDVKNHLFECPICEDVFYTLNNLTEHQEDEEHYKQKWSCPECSTTFRTKQSLHQHQDAKEHTFECCVCSESFYTSDDQEEHQEDEDHFLQQCNRCSRTFRTRENLNQHIRAKSHF